MIETHAHDTVFQIWVHVLQHRNYKTTQENKSLFMILSNQPVEKALINITNKTQLYNVYCKLFSYLTKKSRIQRE